MQYTRKLLSEGKEKRGVCLLKSRREGGLEMVAISLYRGNLHRVPDVPRRWLMPTPKICLKDFKILLNRRSRALSRLRLTADTTTVATTSNPNPSPNLKQGEGTKDEDNSNRESQLNRTNVVDPEEGVSKEGGLEVEVKDEKGSKVGGFPVQSSDELETLHDEECVKDHRGADGGDCSVKTVDELATLHDEEEVKVQKGSKGDGCLVKPGDELVTLDDAKPLVLANASNPVDGHGVSQDQKQEATVNPNSETCKDDALNDKEKRKKEVEEKLKILNARKHNLVQLLKQILNAEEELRRRSNMQGIAVRPSASLQVDVTNDYGSMSRHVTPRPGSEGNGIGDVEGTDADDVSNHNIHSRNMLRMSCMSPSSDSPHRKPAHNMVPNPSRATFAVASSPSRFAPTSQQGNPPSLPTVSVSGTNYITSSPSPAGSGGTSGFRDARLSSPWN